MDCLLQPKNLLSFISNKNSHIHMRMIICINTHYIHGPVSDFLQAQPQDYVLLKVVNVLKGKTNS